MSRPLLAWSVPCHSGHHSSSLPELETASSKKRSKATLSLLKTRTVLQVGGMHPPPPSQWTKCASSGLGHCVSVRAPAGPSSSPFIAQVRDPLEHWCIEEDPGQGLDHQRHTLVQFTCLGRQSQQLPKYAEDRSAMLLILSVKILGKPTRCRCEQLTLV